MSNRWKNYALWASILAFIPLLLEGLEVYNVHAVLPPNYDVLVKAFLGILVLAGIINNPTTENKGFKDDEKSKDDILK